MASEGVFVADADLDPSQRAVVGLPIDASGVVAGAPGSGKTASLVARVRALVAAGVAVDDLVVLTPSRSAATALRDPLGLAVDAATAGPLARSVASFAYHLVRGAEVHRGGEPPQLLTGADEDQIVQDLLAGDAEDEAAGMRRWPDDLPAALRATRGFRSDVRAFLAECTTLGIGPDALDGLAARHDVPAWRAMASFARDYARVRSDMRGAHRDAAGLVLEATQILRTAEPALLGRFASLRVVLVDDAQELTAGGVALLEACRARGIAVLAWGDPDVGSGAFRGATPENFARLAATLGSVLVLADVHRGSGPLVDLVRTVTSRIGAAGVVAHRRAPEGRTGDEVRTFVLRSPAEEIDLIARLLRERHVRDGVPWRSCAVIAHDTRQVVALESELVARDVPARASGPARALGDPRPVRDLLDLVDLAAQDPGEWSPERLADALTGLFGGLDPVELRRVRMQLRAAEIGDGGERPAGELLVSAMRHPLEFEALDTREARRAARTAETLATLRTGWEQGATAHELLWTAWERSGLARPWREAAAGTGPLAAQAGRDLDALVALFQAAKRFGERQPGEPAASFIRAVRDSDVAEDRLDDDGRADAVAVLTPAGAAGRAFDTVVVAGVQDGVWPNTRIRGGLLQTWRLTDAVLHPDAPVAGVLDRRLQAMHDELRLFARSVSRAAHRLVVTAVDDDDTGPSVLFELLPSPQPPSAVPEHPLSLRGLVAEHRRTLTSRASSAAQRRDAAGQLAVLARAGVAGADPASWYGLLAPTSTAPLRDLDVEPVRVSPSRLHALEECQLDWVIADLGGDRQGTTAGIGTVLHAALETGDGADEETLWARVMERWGELEFEAAWRERAERARARDLVRRLALYLRHFEQAGGRLVGAERHFDVPVPVSDPGAHGAVLSGDIDRVEVTREGAVVIVDLKTGKAEPQTDAKVADHPQLAAYQLAHEAGAIESVAGLPAGGAKLLVLRPTAARADYATPTQQPFDDERRAAFLARVDAAVTVMRGTSFEAAYKEHCRDDHSYGLCRIHTIAAVSAS